MAHRNAALGVSNMSPKNGITLLGLGLVLIGLAALGCENTTVEKIELVTCESHADCDDGVYCHGQETCDPDDPLSSSFGCLPGDPCPDLPYIDTCKEEAETCLTAGPGCLTSADCDDGRFCNGAELCDPEAGFADFQGCVEAEERPCSADQVCNEIDDTCETTCPVALDGDGDGHDTAACGGDDCDDDDPDRFPGNTEVCDESGHDEDCDAETFGSRDEDGDGYVSQACFNTRDDGSEAKVGPFRTRQVPFRRNRPRRCPGPGRWGMIDAQPSRAGTNRGGTHDRGNTDAFLPGPGLRDSRTGDPCSR